MVSQPQQHPGKIRIAVAGATGRVGSALVNLLANDPVSLVALTREPAKARFAPQVEMANVDFDQPATLSEALRDVDKLFLAHGTSDRQVRNEIALIDAAVASGVRHIVKLSVMGPTTHLNPFAWHTLIEAHLSAQPVASTVVRPTTFADVLNRAGPQVANGDWVGAAGTGRVNFIDTRDVADVARVALFEDVLAGSQRAYHLTGPKAWSMQDVAAHLSTLLKKPVVYHHRSADEHRAALIASGASAMVADLHIGLDLLFHESILAETTLTIEQLTGKPPRSLSDWLAENLSRFQ